MQGKIMSALNEVQSLREAVSAVYVMADGVVTESTIAGYGLVFVANHAQPHVENLETLLTEMFKTYVEANKEPEEPKDLPFVEPEQTKPSKKKNNDRTAKPVARKKVDHGKIVALHKAGWSGAKIADEMGCSSGVVSTHLKQAREKGEL